MQGRAERTRAPSQFGTEKKKFAGREVVGIKKKIVVQGTLHAHCTLSLRPARTGTKPGRQEADVEY
jgi:hypothetical protein